MVENTNEQIDKNLNIICESNDNQFLITHFVDTDGRKINLISHAERFASKMEDKGLISVNGDFAYVEEFGSEIYNMGGWLAYLNQKTEIENQQEEQLKYKESLELEKTKTDLELAQKMLKEYPKTKLFARIGFGIALGLAAIEIIKFIISLSSDN